MCKVERDEFRRAASRISISAEAAMGRYVWSCRYLAASSGTISDKMFEE